MTVDNQHLKSIKPEQFALEVYGDEMEPEFMAGDCIILDCSIKPRDGDYVIARDSQGEDTFRQFKLLSEDPYIFDLVALNPDYLTMRSDQGQYEIICVVVEQRRYSNFDRASRDFSNSSWN